LAISFTDKFGIDKKRFATTGAFDSILDVDSRLFVDPALLRICRAAEFKNAREKVEKYFTNVITLLSHSRYTGDVFWKGADRLLTFKEPTSTCFGYSQYGTGGNSIGPILRAAILETIRELVRAGETDPSIFELLGVFQEGVGCDRISDLLTFILAPEIRSFTEHLVEKIGISTTEICYAGAKHGALRNEYNGTPIMLLPATLLSPLPVANDYDDIDRICRENERVRADINDYLDLGRRRRLSKSEIYSLMKSNPPFRKTLIAAYRSAPAAAYDFEKDPMGEYAWYSASKKYARNYPCALVLGTNPTVEDLFAVVQQICRQFERLVEDNGLWELLYDRDKKTAKPERAAQQLFFGIADAYCTTNDIDLSREPNAGRGPVDFKLSHGSEGKVLVEVKLTSNPQLKHGIATQLPIYMEQEKTRRAIYLIVDTGNAPALKAFHIFYDKLDAKIKDRIPFLVVDGTAHKSSASKA